MCFETLLLHIYACRIMYCLIDNLAYLFLGDISLILGSILYPRDVCPKVINRGVLKFLALSEDLFLYLFNTLRVFFMYFATVLLDVFAFRIVYCFLYKLVYLSLGDYFPYS